MKREILWFLVAGFSAVGTDMGTYYAFKTILPIFLAKAISFVLGSIVAFLINKYKTFQKNTFLFSEVIKFSVLYLSTLAANVGVNQVILYFFPSWIFFAFLCAIGTSTVLNYLGEKLWVFKSF